MPRKTDTQYYANTDPRRAVSPARNAAEQPRPGPNAQYAHEYRCVSPLLVKKKKKQQRKKSEPDLRANFANTEDAPGSWVTTPYKM
jgi:hypothetical protein